MIRFATLISLALAACVGPSFPALAASFDCTKASTPFENAICENEDLSQADERLARTYATASGGLTELALGVLRNDQRDWLDYARRACTEDAEPLVSGRYDEDGAACLLDVFKSRSGVLEASRMQDGLRFYPISDYSALPDPDAEPGSYWAVAQHELAIVQLDEDEDFAAAFNEAVRLEGEAMQGGEESVAADASSNTTNSIAVEEIAGTGRITLLANTYWYGHGAAHSNYTITYLHYLKDEGRFMQGTDLFAGKTWKKALLDLTVQALQEEHGEALMMEGTDYIEDAVVDPRRWDLSNVYGLEIQFQPYEVSAYAYGAPTATIKWEALAPYLSDNADKVRYGF